MVRLSLLALALLAAPALSGAQVSCQKRDPVTGACVGAPAAEAANRPTALPGPAGVGATSASGTQGLGGVVGPLGGVYESSGLVGCARFDDGKRKCLAKEPSEEERQRAMNSGIEAAMSGLRIQREIMLRAQAMGMMPPAAATPSTQPLGDTAPADVDKQQKPTAASAGASCFQAKLAEAKAAAGRALNSEELMGVGRQCASQ